MDVFLDTGILKNILKKSLPQVAQRFQEEFSKRIVEISRDETHHYIAAPLMLLEYVGMKLPPIASRFANLEGEVATLAAANPFDANKFGSDLLDLFKNHVEGESFSDYALLLNRLDEEAKYRNSYGIELANILFRSNLERIETRYRYITEFSLDEIQGLDFAKIFGGDLERKLTELLTTFGTSLLDPELNVSLARILHQWYMSMPGFPVVKDQARRAQCRLPFLYSLAPHRLCLL